ncbi:MAG: hypothetical protein DDT35_00187 [Firmicutes bacterium]|nr:hypothetical protein [Bacillota bacterium]
MPPLNGLDYVLLLVVGFFTLVGLRRGLVRQVVDLVAWAGAIYLAFAFGSGVAAELNRLFALEAHLSRALGPLWGNFAIGAAAVNVLGFVVVFMIARLVAAFVAGVLDMFAELPVINSFNRLGGAGFGLIKGVVAIFFFSTIVKAVPVGAFSLHIETSYVVNTVLGFSPHLYEYLREFILRVRPVV